MNEIEQRQFVIIKDRLSLIREKENPTVLNKYISDIYTLLSFFKGYSNVYQDLFDQWGALEILNSIVLSEDRSIMSDEEKQFKQLTVDKFNKLLDKLS
jgi:hypothetical protein